MLVEILTFLATHEVVITGSVTVLSEIVVIIVNMVRRLRKHSKDIKIMSGTVPSMMQNLIWSANPINLFREP